MNKRILGGLAAAVMLTGGLAFSTAGTVAAAATSLCPNNTDGYGPKINYTGGNPTVEYIADDGFLVAGYCVKAGGDTEQSQGGVAFVPVDPPTKTVDIDHPTKDSVSHYSVLLVPDVEDEPIVVAPKFKYTEPTCEAAGTAEPVETTGISWVKDENGVWAASAKENYVLAVGDFKFGPFTTDKLSGEMSCPTTVVVVPTPPTPEPEVEAIAPVAPANRPAPDVVSAFSPAQAPPAEVSALPSVLPAQALPSTGIDGTGITAIIALLLTSLGGAALFLSRRRNVTV